MTFNDFLFKALFVSLTLHTIFICSSYFINYQHQQKNELMKKRVEISYKAPQKKAPDVKQRPIKPVQQLDLNNTASASLNGAVPVRLVKEHQSASAKFMHERKPENMHTMPMAHRVSITPIKSEKINNPAYAAYNEIVRSRIEERVYNNYDRMEKGKVYLTFIIDAAGNLKVAQLIPEKTNATQHLQDISLRSLKDASPFPAFLKGMSLPEYTFNIEVQYQIKD